MIESELRDALTKLDERLDGLEAAQIRHQTQWSTGVKVLAGLGAILVGGVTVISAARSFFR